MRMMLFALAGNLTMSGVLIAASTDNDSTPVVPPAVPEQLPPVPETLDEAPPKPQPPKKEYFTFKAPYQSISQIFKNFEPTLGVTFAPFPFYTKNLDGPYRTTRHSKMFVLALPNKIKTWPSEDYSEPPMHLVLFPELDIGSHILAGNLGAGFETKLSMGWHQNPAALQIGGHTGFYGSYIIDNLHAGGRTSYAMFFNFVFGPEWDFRDSVALKFQINPKLVLGKLARRTIQTTFMRNLGVTLGLNLQLEFF